MMTNLLANTFETIAAQPRVVPVAVERVIQAGVDASYLNVRLHQAMIVARAKVVGARVWLARVRCGDENVPEHYTEEFATKALYAALDRVWEAQCMVSVAYVPVPPASVLTEILS